MTQIRFWWYNTASVHTPAPPLPHTGSEKAAFWVEEGRRVGEHFAKPDDKLRDPPPADSLNKAWWDKSTAITYPVPGLKKMCGKIHPPLRTPKWRWTYYHFFHILYWLM